MVLLLRDELVTQDLVVILDIDLRLDLGHVVGRRRSSLQLLFARHFNN